MTQYHNLTSKQGNSEAANRATMTDEKTATFFVAEADDDSAILSDVSDAQVHTLSENPGVEAGEVLTATVAPDPRWASRTASLTSKSASASPSR